MQLLSYNNILFIVSSQESPLRKRITDAYIFARIKQLKMELYLQKSYYATNFMYYFLSLNFKYTMHFLFNTFIVNFKLTVRLFLFKVINYLNINFF